ncbi:MAG: hydrophobic protein [Candidatus Dormibacteria bacterium]
MLALALIVLALLLFGGGLIGTTLHFLWIVALIVLVLAAASFLMGRRGAV